MRTLTIRILGLVLLMMSSLGLSMAQNSYYWGDGQRIALSEDRSAVIIQFKEGAAPEELMTTRQASLSLEIHAVQRRVVATFAQALSSPAEALRRLGIPASSVKSVSFARQLEDGFRLYLTHHVVLEVGKGHRLSDLDATLRQFGARHLRSEALAEIIEVTNIDQVLPLANALQEQRLAAWATPDWYAQATRYQDPLYAQQFQMNNTGQTIDGFAGVTNMDCNAPEAWAITTGSSSITVAVIDDGVEAHEDLVTSTGASRVLGGYTPVGNGNGTPNASGAHGQACAGIIAASHNTIGVRGVAPQVNLRSVNIFAGGETTQDLANAITWAKNNGAAVLSNSWGYTSCTFTATNLTNAINDASTTGRGGLGCVIVFASGNGYKTCVDYPANLAAVIAVGAFGNDGIKSSYSNAGSVLDICAPSNDVSSAGALTGAGVRTIDRTGSAGYSTGNYTNTFGGTSAACPVVAGVAALVLSVNASLTLTQVKDILYTSAIDMGTAGFDNSYGNGRVNALGAVQAAGGSGGGGGGGGTTCTDNALALTLVFDNYPEETRWEVRSGTTVVASGGTYGSQADGSTLVVDLCLPDGCYDLVMFDSYGDGMCCSYGNGSYTLRDASNAVLAAGGSFTTSQTTNFCLGGGGGGGGSCPAINFNSYTINSYGGSQDQGTFQVQDAGATLFIQNNAWKSISLNYTVTTNTVVEFDFQSTIQGETHGIGFDNNNSISSNFTFKVHGTQNWGITNFDNYSGSGWTTYVIPVGSFYTGAFNRLVFCGDDDSNPRTGNSYFRNVKIYEGACPSSSAAIVLNQGPVHALMGTETEGSLVAYPNPAQTQLTVELPGSESVSGLTLYDLHGRVLWRENMESSTTIDLGVFPAGVYLLTVQTEAGLLSERVVIQK